MDKLESQEIIKWVLNNINFSKIIITTPNYEFNVNYLLENEYRRHDHKWELNRTQFKDYIGEISELTNYNLTFIDIGDIVDNVPCSQGLLITNKIQKN